MDLKIKTGCTAMESSLADLLLDPSAEPAALPAKVQKHIAGCERCRGELAELRATMDLLDTWELPEPSPYFLTRFNARLREERQAEPAGWFARLRARLVSGTAAHIRPLAAMALTTILLIGGGAYLGVTNWDQTAKPSSNEAVVRDLQTLDNNAQLLDQLETISSNDNGGD